MRREPLHPGAQQTLDDVDGHRFTCFRTDQRCTDLAVLDLRRRGRARIEQRIRDLTDTGWGNLPSADFAINQVWAHLAILAADLLTFLAGLCLEGSLAVAEPKTIRCRLLHVAGRLTRTGRRTRMRVDHTWPPTTLRRVRADGPAAAGVCAGRCEGVATDCGNRRPGPCRGGSRPVSCG